MKNGISVSWAIGMVVAALVSFASGNHIIMAVIHALFSWIYIAWIVLHSRVAG